MAWVTLVSSVCRLFSCLRKLGICCRLQFRFYGDSIKGFAPGPDPMSVHPLCVKCMPLSRVLLGILDVQLLVSETAAASLSEQVDGMRGRLFTQVNYLIPDFNLWFSVV